MIKVFTDLKSFITVAMITLLFIVVIANLKGATLADNLLILVTNLITAVFTYYFTKKDSTSENIKNEEEK